MPRNARQTSENMTYHVTVRGNNRDWIFCDDDDFNNYRELVRRYRERYGLKIFHWVIMNNHAHFLLWALDGVTLSKAMQGLSLAYTSRYNRKYNRVGQLWQGRYKSIPVEESTYLLECGRYIERNPVRAGIVSVAEDYPWSSYQAHYSGHNDELTDSHPLMNDFQRTDAGFRSGWAEYVNTHREREDQELKLKFACGAVGAGGFAEKLRRGRIEKLRPKPGRPKMGV